MVKRAIHYRSPKRRSIQEQSGNGTWEQVGRDESPYASLHPLMPRQKCPEWTTAQSLPLWAGKGRGGEGLGVGVGGEGGGTEPNCMAHADSVGHISANTKRRVINTSLGSTRAYTRTGLQIARTKLVPHFPK